MAKKRSNEEKRSGDEMDVSSPGKAASDSDSGSGSESESYHYSPSLFKPRIVLPAYPSSSEEASDSESGSDPGTHKPNPAVKPLSSKPMKDPHKSNPTTSKKSRSKVTATLALPNTGSVAKRPADDGEAKESKKSKRKPEKKVENLVQKPPSEDVKRQLFQRLWSEDDEIAILKGMIDYRLKKKSDPVGDLNAFHEFIKKSLHVDVSKTQLQDKIRRLKKKYVNNAGKEKKGKERTFSKYHEQKAYDLSKKIWGKDKIDKVVENNVTAKKGESKSAVKDNGVSDDGVKEEDHKSVVEVEENVAEGLKIVSFVSCGASIGDIEKWLEENSGLISVEKRNEMNEKLRSLKFAELDLCSKRIKLMDEQVSLVREAMEAYGINALLK